MSPSIRLCFRHLAHATERVGRGTGECYEGELILCVAKRWRAMADGEPVGDEPPHLQDFRQDDGRTFQ